MTNLIITFVGNDRPGFVARISDVVLAHKGNWGNSRMSEMAGRFAGIIEIEVDESRVDALIADFEALDSSGMAHIQIERGDDGSTDASGRYLSVEVVTQDHPGIVHDISEVLSGLSVSIHEMDSDRIAATNGAGFLFAAMMALRLPNELDADDVIDALQNISDDLMIDVIEDEA